MALSSHYSQIAHVGATLASLPPTILHYPFEKWTSLIWGNILMPSALFFARYVHIPSSALALSLPPGFPFGVWSLTLSLTTASLLTLSSLWFLGVGRPTYGLRKEQVQPPRSKGYARVPTAEVKRD